MQIELPPDLEPFVEQEFSTGRYSTREEVIIQAIVWLRDERSQALAGIQEGISDLHTGKVQSITDAFSDLKREFGLTDSE